MSQCNHDWETEEVIGSDARPGVKERCEKCGATRERFQQSHAPRHQEPKGLYVDTDDDDDRQANTTGGVGEL